MVSPSHFFNYSLLYCLLLYISLQRHKSHESRERTILSPFGRIRKVSIIMLLLKFDLFDYYISFLFVWNNLSFLFLNFNVIKYNSGEIFYNILYTVGRTYILKLYSWNSIPNTTCQNAWHPSIMRHCLLESRMQFKFLQYIYRKK